MEVKNIHKHAGWYASYMNAPDGGNDAQGKALVLCQEKKIKQLSELIETIRGDIELYEQPQECSAEEVLESIKCLINRLTEVEYSEDGFKWIG